MDGNFIQIKSFNSENTPNPYTIYNLAPHATPPPKHIYGFFFLGGGGKHAIWTYAYIAQIPKYWLFSLKKLLWNFLI